MNSENRLTFGSKIHDLRKKKSLSQTELGRAVGVSLRTVRGWETEGKLPRKSELYGKLADVLGCEEAFLRGELESFVTEAGEMYGLRGMTQAQRVLAQADALFAGGELTEEDQDAFMRQMQAIYWDAKEKARQKYTPKKYRDNDHEKASAASEESRDFRDDTAADTGKDVTA